MCSSGIFFSSAEHNVIYPMLKSEIGQNILMNGHKRKHSKNLHDASVSAVQFGLYTEIILLSINIPGNRIH